MYPIAVVSTPIAMLSTIASSGIFSSDFWAPVDSSAFGLGLNLFRSPVGVSLSAEGGCFGGSSPPLISSDWAGAEVLVVGACCGALDVFELGSSAVWVLVEPCEVLLIGSYCWESLEMFDEDLGCGIFVTFTVDELEDVPLLGLE